MAISKTEYPATDAQPVVIYGLDTPSNGAAKPILQTSGAMNVTDTIVSALLTTLTQKNLTDDSIFKVLQEIKNNTHTPLWYVDASNALSVLAAINGGTLTTVTTVTTVGNQTNIGGYSADRMTENASVTEWASAIRPLYV